MINCSVVRDRGVQKKCMKGECMRRYKTFWKKAFIPFSTQLIWTHCDNQLCNLVFKTVCQVIRRSNLFNFFVFRCQIEQININVVVGTNSTIKLLHSRGNWLWIHSIFLCRCPCTVFDLELLLTTYKINVMTKNDSYLF